MENKLSFLAGVLVAAVITYYAQRERWQMEAWNHHAACFEYNLHDAKLRPIFTWLDDHYAKQKPPVKRPNWIKI